MLPSQVRGVGSVCLCLGVSVEGGLRFVLLYLFLHLISQHFCAKLCGKYYIKKD